MTDPTTTAPALPEGAMQTALDFWTTQLVGKDVVDTHNDEQLDRILATMRATRSTPPVDAERVATFREVLRGIIEREWVTQWEWTAKRDAESEWGPGSPASLFLDMDYHPCRFLTEALEAAGITEQEAAFGHGARLWIKADEVMTRQGNEFPVLWP